MGLQPWEDILGERFNCAKKLRLLWILVLHLFCFPSHPKITFSSSDVKYVSKRGMVREIKVFSQSSQTVLSCTSRPILVGPSWIPSLSKFQQLGKLSSTPEKTHPPLKTIQSFHLKRLRLNMKNTPGRESCGFALPPLPKNLPWKSLDLCNRILSSDAPPPFPWPPLFYAGRKSDDTLSHISLGVPRSDFSPGEVSDQSFLRLCWIHELQLSGWLLFFFVSGMHMVGESPSNKTCPPIPLCKWKNVPYGRPSEKFLISRTPKTTQTPISYEKISVVCAESYTCRVL